MQFLCLFSPSREDVPEYQTYGEECLAEADRVNAGVRHQGRGSRSTVKVQEDYAYAVAAYDLYDVLLVNPTYDGMNLVAMEGPLVNRRDGVLVLSRNAGAFAPARAATPSASTRSTSPRRPRRSARRWRCRPTNGPGERAGWPERCRRTRRPRGSPTSSRPSTRSGRRRAGAEPAGRSGTSSVRSYSRRRSPTSPAGPVHDDVGGLA